MPPLGDWNRGLVKLFNKRRGHPPCKRTGWYRVYSDFTGRKMIQLLCVKADDLTLCLFIKNDTFTDRGSNEIGPQAPSRLPNALQKLMLTTEPPGYRVVLLSKKKKKKQYLHVHNWTTSRVIYCWFWTKFKGFFLGPVCILCLRRGVSE